MHFRTQVSDAQLTTAQSSRHRDASEAENAGTATTPKWNLMLSGDYKRCIFISTSLRVSTRCFCAMLPYRRCCRHHHWQCHWRCCCFCLFLWHKSNVLHWLCSDFHCFSLSFVVAVSIFIFHASSACTRIIVCRAMRKPKLRRHRMRRNVPLLKINTCRTEYIYTSFGNQKTVCRSNEINADINEIIMGN